MISSERPLEYASAYIVVVVSYLRPNIRLIICDKGDHQERVEVVGYLLYPKCLFRI